MNQTRFGVVVVTTLAATLFGLGSAAADGGRVALVKPSANTATVTEAMTRIRGELAADGFEVVLVESATAPGPTPEGSTAPDSGAIASIELVVDVEGHAAELRVMDRLTNKTVSRRTTIEATGASQFAQVLAVRAVELLRASLLELLIQARPPPAPATPPAVAAATQRASEWAASALERESTWAVDAGTAVLAGFGGVPAALLGVLRVRRAIVQPFEVRVTAAGLGTQPRVASSQGSASVSQELGLLDLVVGMWSKSVVHPVASLGAGALCVSTEGAATAESPQYVGQKSSRCAFLADVGIGGELRLSDRFEVSLEGHAFITRPYPVIRFVDQDVARISQPSLLGALTVVGWL